LRPALDLIVAIDASLEKTTGLITWHFLSLDPLTGQFTEDPVAGFLPPNVTPPEGDGSVAFTIEPTVTDIPICNQASIIFDVNEAILTPEWCNTVDTTPPSSQVLALAPTQSSPTFTIEWSGTDAGAGIADYTVFVSENGEAFVPFVTDTTATSAPFTGQPGTTYAFYSSARDALGHVEAPPATPDAETMIDDPAVPTETAPPVATSTPTRAPTATASATALPDTPTPTAAPTRTSTDTPTRAPTASPTATRSPTSTIAPTRTPTSTPTPGSSPPPLPCGDLDGDGRVTLADVVIEAAALVFGSRDPRFDLNQDGRVTVSDLAIVGRQVGRSC
jgi:hypothetical protein